jgi:hypothetical protein
MEVTDISALVDGNPPTIFNPNYSGPNHPGEIAQLQKASESGNRHDVRELSSSGKFTKDQLVCALTSAERNGHANVVSYLLSIGVSAQPFHVEDAIRSSDYDRLSLFLTNGYEINKQTNWNTPSLLM